MVHRYTSWGRTRGPKNLAGAHGTEVASATSAPTVTDATAGYPTENQRFLHILLDTATSGENRTITVLAYTHATGRWAPLTDIRGNAVTTGAVNNTSVHKVFEISGVDRVFFFASGAIAANDFLLAACSTF
tara:strand:- start:2367 stop:2759 length:393 start_codon:yes stop_codon:yes gene_type:complete